MLSLAFTPCAWQCSNPRRTTAHAVRCNTEYNSRVGLVRSPAVLQTAAKRRSTLTRASAGGSSEAEAALWTVGLAAAAYFSSYASEGYEPHRL